MKRNANVALTLVAVMTFGAAAAGFMIGRVTAPGNVDEADRARALAAENKRLHESLEHLTAQQAQLRGELGKVSKIDMADYLRLQGEEAQFAKSKEILGKLFLLLLHNALFDAPKEQVAFAKKLAGQQNDSAPSGAAEPGGGTTPAGKEAAATPDKPSQPGGDPASTAKPGAKNPAPWAKAEGDLAGVTPDKSNAFLDAAVIPNLGQELEGGQAFTSDDQRLAHLQGTFSGTVTFLDPAAKPWQMEIELRTEVNNGLLSGSVQVHLSENGQHFSDSNSNGTLANAVFNPATQSQALIVRDGQGSRYYQLYYIDGQDALIGNYYEVSPSGTSVRKGRIVLNR